MCADLITRIYAAGKRNDERVESKKVINGLYNKLGMIMLIVLSLILDYSLVFITDMIGINIEGKILFTAFTLAWMFVREFISCLENLNHGGIKLPHFITDALNVIKDKIDQTAENLIPKGGQDEHKTM